MSDYALPLHAIPMNQFVYIKTFINKGKYCDRDMDKFLEDESNDIVDMEKNEPERRLKKMVEETSNVTSKYDTEISKLKKFNE